MDVRNDDHSGEPTKQVIPDSLMPILAACLRENTVAPFDIWVHPTWRGEPMLYREASIKLEEHVVERLRDGEMGTVLIDTKNAEQYYAYLDENLTRIVSDEHLPVEERSTVLYESATQVMRNLMNDPRAGDLCQRADAVVESTIGFLDKTSGAFSNLLKVASYDYYTYTHSMNVFMFSVALAQRVGIGGKAEMKEFGTAALLHDVGKSRITNDILNYRGKLDAEQWREMQNHTVYGHDILVQQGQLSNEGLSVVRHHHEKLHGTGYPDKLSGAQIHPWVRIVTVCDIFDALTTQRSYKQAIDSFRALQIMREEMGADLDPKIFRTFIEMMSEGGPIHRGKLQSR